MNFLLNFLFFQIGWFACVLGAAYGYSSLGSSIAVCIVLMHVILVPDRRNEIWFISFVTIVGTFWECFLVAQQWLVYPEGQFSPFLAPHWIIAMWALFAMTINHSMLWMRGRMLLASVSGAIFGPLSFLAGEKLGAVAFLDREMAFLMLATGWAWLMPLIMTLTDMVCPRPVAHGTAM